MFSNWIKVPITDAFLWSKPQIQLENTKIIQPGPKNSSIYFINLLSLMIKRMLMVMLVNIFDINIGWPNVVAIYHGL